MSRHAALFETVENSPERVIIRDIGHNQGRRTVTNDVEAVVKAIAPMLEGRRLFYFDSQGDPDEIVYVGDRFLRFAPGPNR